MTELSQISIAVNLGTLAALIYTLRVLIALDRKVSKLLALKGISR